MATALPFLCYETLEGMPNCETHKRTNTSTIFHVWAKETEVANFNFRVLKVHLTVSQVKFFSQKHVANLPETLRTVRFFSHKNEQ